MCRLPASATERPDTVQHPVAGGRRNISGHPGAVQTQAGSQPINNSGIHDEANRTDRAEFAEFDQQGRAFRTGDTRQRSRQVRWDQPDQIVGQVRRIGSLPSQPKAAWRTLSNIFMRSAVASAISITVPGWPSLRK